MLARTLKIENETGLHLRPASRLVDEANKFRSHVMMTHGEYQINCKSLMSILAFPVCPGDKVTLVCEGEDEERAFQRILQLLQYEI